MFKKTISLLVIVLGFSTASFAQKYAYIDLSYMLNNIPEYKEAQKKIDDLSTQWQQEIDTKYKEITELNRNYQNEEVLLTDDMKKQRKQEIQDKEKEAKDLQKKRFGYQGDLFKKREELIKPIQDKVYDAVQKFADLRGYEMIFDKSSSVTLFYASTKADVSDNILTQMGYTPHKDTPDTKDKKTKSTTPAKQDNSIHLKL